MDKCDAGAILKEKGLKITQQRLSLLETIIDSEEIFSAVSLHENLKNSMDLVTIYRIISVFLENNIIREVVSSEVTRFYELSCEHHPVHPHFICKKCNDVICLESVNANYLKEIIKISKDNIIENIIIQFSGICFKCK